MVVYVDIEALHAMSGLHIHHLIVHTVQMTAACLIWQLKACQTM